MLSPCGGGTLSIEKFVFEAVACGHKKFASSSSSTVPSIGGQRVNQMMSLKTGFCHKGGRWFAERWLSSNRCTEQDDTSKPSSVLHNSSQACSNTFD